MLSSFVESLSENKKNFCRTNTYSLATNLVENSLEIQLTIGGRYEYEQSLQEEFDYLGEKTSCKKKFINRIIMDDLGEELEDKFENLKNVQVFLSDSNNLNVNHENGTIELIMTLSLFNGKFISSKLGEIKLHAVKEIIQEKERSLNEILEMCNKRKELKLSEVSMIIKEFTGFFKTVFDKLKKYEQKQELFENAKIIEHHKFQNEFQLKKNEGDTEPKRDKKISFKSERALQNLLSPPRLAMINNQSVDKIDRKFSLNNSDFNLLDSSSMKNTKNEQKRFDKSNNLVWKEELEELREEINASMLEIKTNDKSTILKLKQNLDMFQEEMRNDMKSLKSDISKENNSNLLSFLLNVKDIPAVDCIQKVDEKYFFKFVELENKIAAIQEQIESLNNCFKSAETKITNFSKAQNRFEEKFSDIIESLDLHNSNKIIENAVFELKNEILDVRALFFLSQFELKGLNITYKGEDSQSTMLFSKKIISNENFCFSIKIVKSLVNNIQIGIADQEYRDLQDCWELPNFILYVGWSSTIYEGPSNLVAKEGAKFQEGDIVTVKVNMETSTIEWFVGHEVKSRIIWDKLKNESVKWVPMIRFFDNGDIIGWVTEDMWKV